jgi:hypothetical protein
MLNHASTASFFLDGSFSLRGGSYVPFYYWLNCLNDGDLIQFISNSYSTSHVQKIGALNKIIIATGNERWINFIEQIGLSYQKRFTQASTWVWILDDMLHRLEKKKEDPIYALKEFYPTKKIMNVKASDLLEDENKTKRLLTESCDKFSKGTNSNRSEIKMLDLIESHKKLQSRLPDPPELINI